jgi:hypothetical protein
MKIHEDFYFYVSVVINLILSLLFAQSTPTNLKWTALSLRHCNGNRINVSNDKITKV